MVSELKNIDISIVDVKKTIDEYQMREDWRIRENSNTGYCFSGLEGHVSGKAIAKYTLYGIYPNYIKKAHTDGHFHIHDLSKGFIGYCAGWSVSKIIREGLGGVSGQTESKPAKYLDTAVVQIANFLGILQNEFAGAQAFSSIDTYLAPFVKEYYERELKKLMDFAINSTNTFTKLMKDGAKKLAWEETERYTEQCMQKLVYHLNTETRWGGQTPFTNLSFDWKVPDDLKWHKAIIGGKEQEYTLGDCQKEANLINKCFLKVMEKGDGNSNIFTFPIPTYNLTKDFDWDSPNAELLFEVTAKYGTPYFQNYIGSNLDPSSIRAMCCRLQLDQTELLNRPGGMWGMGEATGSIGVVTLNINRFAIESKGKYRLFFRLLEKYADLASESLEIKRGIINQNLENGLMPYTKRYLDRKFVNHFSTIGLVGVNEASINMGMGNIGTADGLEFAKEILAFLKKKLVGYQESSKFNALYNLEASPAEGASYRLAKLDKKHHPEKYLSGSSKSPFLTNSTFLPYDFSDDIIAALEHQTILQPMYTGGTIFHAFLGEKITPGGAKTLVKMIAKNTTLPYFSLTPTFSICQDHGYLSGEQKKCPTCSKKTMIYSRIVGYFRPVQNWNDGKKAEFNDRITYKV